MPDIEIIFKTHPIVQKSNLISYPEAQQALDIIKDKMDENFVLDNHGYIGVFEVGHRVNNDKRLEFETFVTFLQQI